MLATGDSDFGPVFRRLRELGKGVVGVGPSSVLSSSVALSCHEFIFTDDDSSGRSGSAKKGRGKGARGDRTGATATWAGTAGRGALRTRLATPPQLLSARGGFRFKPQPSGGGDGGRQAARAGEGHRAGYGERGGTMSPLLIGDAPASPPPPPPPPAAEAAATTFGRGKVPVIDWTAMPPPSTPPPLPSPKFDLSEAFSRVSLGESVLPAAAPAAAPAAPAVEPVLSPGQLLLPGMVTAAAASASSPAVSTEPPAFADAATRSPGTTHGLQGSWPQAGGDTFAGVGASGGVNSSTSTSTSGRRAAAPSAPSTPPPLMPPAFGGLGALSVIRPSEKLYRHLLALDSSASSTPGAGAGGTGSLASDCGNGLSEVTVARGLVSLAEACGGQNGEHARAMEALGGFFADNNGTVGGAAGGGGLGREEAFRVASLLQRCGFLSWVAKEQQWLVTVPADVEVLRRRRDEAMMEELLIRCQEAGVPFEPALAANLLWSRGGTAEAVGLRGEV